MADLSQDPFAKFALHRATRAVDNVEALSDVFCTKDGVKFRLEATITIVPLPSEEADQFEEEDCMTPNDIPSYQEEYWT